jgi:hypothetical protein
MADNNSRVKKSNISTYDSELSATRKPQGKDVVWFGEKLSTGGIGIGLWLRSWILSFFSCMREDRPRHFCKTGVATRAIK